MSGGRAWAALATLMLLSALAAPGRAAPPLVTAVETSSITPLPDDRVRAAIGELRGRPLTRDAVRASLDRLWGLGLFSAIRVDEVPKPDGIVLRFVFTTRPLIRKISWEGEPGLDLAEVAAVAALAVGEEASPERLARAERDVLARYRENGYLAATRDRRELRFVSTAGSDAAERSWRTQWTSPDLTDTHQHFTPTNRHVCALPAPLIRLRGHPRLAPAVETAAG